MQKLCRLEKRTKVFYQTRQGMSISALHLYALFFHENKLSVSTISSQQTCTCIDGSTAHSDFQLIAFTYKDTMPSLQIGNGEMRIGKLGIGEMGIGKMGIVEMGSSNLVGL